MFSIKYTIRAMFVATMLSISATGIYAANTEENNSDKTEVYARPFAATWVSRWIGPERQTVRVANRIQETLRRGLALRERLLQQAPLSYFGTFTEVHLGAQREDGQPETQWVRVWSAERWRLDLSLDEASTSWGILFEIGCTPDIEKTGQLVAIRFELPKDEAADTVDRVLAQTTAPWHRDGRYVVLSLTQNNTDTP